MRAIMNPLIAALVLVVSVAAQPAPPDVGYVVTIDGGGTWEARPTAGATRALRRGDGVRAGDRLLVTGVTPTRDHFVDVLFYATGSVRRLRSGEIVRSGAPPAEGALSRLIAALRRRLDSETVGSAVVRGDAAAHAPPLRDGVMMADSAPDWRRLVLAKPGSYQVQFRRLNEQGAPNGEWSAMYPFTVTAKGVDAQPLGSNVGIGLWQMTLRDPRDPSRGGEAWVLFTNDASAPARFDELSAVLEADVRRDGTLGVTAVRIRRAALLELSSPAPVSR
jgi:hypothetical protein